MKLENSFEVPAGPDQAWDLLLDVPRVVPCMPGAELTEVVDDSTWKAKMSVKLGPISLTFDTDIKREDVDEEAKKVTLSAKGRELRGRGQARATVESSMAAVDGGTRIDIVTDLALSGPAAQYGRGMVADVSSQLVGRFADCIRTQLETPAEPETAQAREGATGESATGESATGEAAPSAPPARPPAPPAPPPQPAKPVGGLRLVFGALLRSIVRFFRRLFGRE
ncbi:MAG TPA: SRPBCC family protein [Thermoleophilaceae bacterium]|jgi:carbon monoxide dehydrogenase subunit G